MQISIFLSPALSRPVQVKQKPLSQTNPYSQSVYSEGLAQPDALDLRFQTVQPRFSARTIDKTMNIPGEDGLTALERACKNKTINRIPTLIAYGADPDRRNAEGDTLLLQIVSKENLDLQDLVVIQMLLRIGAKVDKKNAKGATPLLQVISKEKLDRNHLNVIKVLLLADADVQAVDQNGKTPLSEAKKRHPSVVNLLQENIMPSNLQKLKRMAREAVRTKSFYHVNDALKRHKTDISVSFIPGYYLRGTSAAGRWYNKRKAEVSYIDAFSEWWSRTTDSKQAEFSFFERQLYRYKEFPLMAEKIMIKG